MRAYISSLTAIIAAVAVLGCSADSLDPAPGTDTQHVRAAKGTDTAITTNPQTPPQVPPVVSSFALSGVVYGLDVGPDTTHQTPLTNAKVTLVKVGSVNGDTLNPSVTITSTTTNAQGEYRLENLEPAYYRIDFTAPPSSPYGNSTRGIGPARETEIKVSVALGRKS